MADHSNNVRGLVVLAALAACGAPDGALAPAPTSAAAAPVTSTPAPPSGPLSEHAARVALADGLRRAGYRVQADIERPLVDGSVVLDGWDGERQVGFEYQATGEGDAALSAQTVAALGDKVLVVGPADEAAIRAALDRFLASLPPIAPPVQP